MPRRYRKRRTSSESDSAQPEDTDETVVKKLEETREVQKFRKRPGGVSVAGLAFGKKFSEEDQLVSDPFKLKTGGLVNMREIQDSENEKVEDEVLQRLASNFSAETKQRDDDTHMLSYIEQEMAKRNPKQDTKSNQPSSYETRVKMLYQLPERLVVQTKSKNEEMLSNQMLSGIPEVDLGLEAKFKNIEETELAKQKLVEEKFKKERDNESLAPSNVATNYTLHRLRFHKEDGKKREEARQEKEAPPTYVPVVGETGPELKAVGESNKRSIEQSQLATDDYHYDKYRKKLKRF